MKRAVCNELFGNLDFASQAAVVRRLGYQGLELAPHTFFDDFSNFRRRRQSVLKIIRSVLDGERLDFAGLHWLLVGPKDLFINDPDARIRKKAWDHLKRLADFAGELGGGPLTFGSPIQRRSRGTGKARTMEFFANGLREHADHFRDTGCRLLMEALPANQRTDVLNTLEEVRDFVDSVNHPAVGSMFDFHNTDDERHTWPELIWNHRKHTAHVHLNAPGGGPPTVATTRFIESFQTLKEIGYDGWISLEIFTTPEDYDGVLARVGSFLDQVAGQTS